MGVPVVTMGSTVLCSHGGKVTLVPMPRVKANGQPVVLISTPGVVGGCAFPPPPVANGPCVSVTFVTGSVRVLVMGQPIVTQASVSVAAPTGTPAVVVVPEPRVMVT